MTHKPRPRPDTPHYMTEERLELQASQAVLAGCRASNC